MFRPEVALFMSAVRDLNKSKIAHTAAYILRCREKKIMPELLQYVLYDNARISKIADIANIYHGNNGVKRHITSDDIFNSVSATLYFVNRFTELDEMQLAEIVAQYGIYKDDSNEDQYKSYVRQSFGVDI